MLSFETKTRLADLFFAISEGERQIEVVRQILCEQVDFEPYAAFKRIDRSRKGSIDSYDLLKFLADNKIQSTEENCRAFIRRYDVDGDGQLVYNEFLCAVLPMDNPTLRTIASQRPNYDVAENEYLSYDVEYSLSKVIDREINLYTSLDYPKASLHKCYDFNYLDAFNTINITPGKITFNRLEEFFKKLGLYPNEDQLVAMLRRLDRDDDGCLTYEEFVMGLEPLHNLLAKNSTVNKSFSSTRDYASPSKSRVYNPARNPSEIEEQSQSFYQSNNRAHTESIRRIASPSRANVLQRDITPLARNISPSRNLNSTLRKVASPTRAYSPSRVISPQRSNSNLRRVASPSKGFSPSRVLSHNRTNSSLRLREAESLQDSFNKSSFLNQERQERPASPVKYPAKESQSQFRSTASTLKVAERVSSPLRVTLNNVGRVQSSPLRQSQLGSSVGTGNRRLLKSSEKSILKKNGTYSMSGTISETTQTQTQVLASSIKKENKKNAKFEGSDAKLGLIEALKQFVQLEKELENGKQDLALRPDFNLLDFFRIFDMEGRGAVSNTEIREGLERFGVIASKDQLYLFVRRFDRDNDGKLKFSDFAEAFTCKQQEYANLLNNRTPINADLSLAIDQTFSEETVKTVARALRMHLDNEVSTEAIRQRLARRYKFNAHEGFSYLDVKEDGVITVEELGEVLDKNDSYVTQKDLSMVVDRMDINKDGKVTYSEFVQEMTPKSERVF